MTKNIENSSCWIITEGMIGTENQCVGIAKALNIEPVIKKIALKEPWKSLSPFLGFERHDTFIPPIEEPWPDILIASGRKSIAASRYIKKMSQEKTFTVQVQDPRVSAKNFNLVAVPHHDPMRASNVIVTHATPNKITTKCLEDAKKAFSSFEQLPSPRVAVLIGGKSKAYDMSSQTCDHIISQLSQLKASLMITCSRRTGEENRAHLKEALDNDLNFFWDGKGDNPYLGMLAWADYILVTADSASMISESCTTGKPVHMIDLDGGSRRISALHDRLIEHGFLRKFDGTITSYEYEPLNDAQIVANEVKKQFEAFTNA